MLILVFIQERTLLLVSGRIESSDFSLSRSSCSISLVLLPSFLLSLSPSGSPSFLPSFLPWDVARSSGKCTQNKSAHSAVTVRICIIVRSHKNLHTCKLPLTGSRSPLVKYARGSHIGFHSTSQTCSLRASNAQVRYLHRISTWPQHIPIHNLLPLEKERKSVQAGYLGSS